MALRRRCHAGLNKGEQRHALAQAICTFRQGRIADRGAEAQEYRASGLNLLIAAIVYWNSTYMPDAIAHRRAKRKAVSDELLAHTSPAAGSISACQAISCGSGLHPPQLDDGRSISSANAVSPEDHILYSFYFSVVYLTPIALSSWTP
ncbi:transposase (plasmid) [Azospirillum sp. B510]|nr:transposase [Azospirillum sp. B510]